MQAITKIRKLHDLLVNGPGLAAIEMADTVSGGHMKEAAKTSDALFSAATDTDTRDAALQGLDLARLNDARFRVVLELLESIVEVQDELTSCWRDYDESQRPELRDLMAASALVANGYARQQSHQRRQLIVDALRGSMCPEPYLWGFQDELLRDLIEAGLTVDDVDLLRHVVQRQSVLYPEAEALLPSWEFSAFERMNARGIVMISQLNPNPTTERIVRSRYDYTLGGINHVRVLSTHKGTKLITMIDAGRSLRTPQA